MGRLHQSATYSNEMLEEHRTRSQRNPSIQGLAEENASFDGEADKWEKAAAEITRSDPDGMKSLALMKMMEVKGVI